MKGAEHSEDKCAVPSCSQPNPKIYDERTELTFCDTICLIDYIAQYPEEFAEWYIDLYISENDVP